MGYPIQSWWGGDHGYPPPSRPGQGGTPHHPDLAGVPSPHHQDLAGVPPTIKTWLGYPPTIQTWPGYPPHHPDLAGVPPSPVKVWTDKQTENSTFPHPSDAGGNKSGMLILLPLQFVDFIRYGPAYTLCMRDHLHLHGTTWNDTFFVIKMKNIFSKTVNIGNLGWTTHQKLGQHPHPPLH